MSLCQAAEAGKCFHFGSSARSKFVSYLPLRTRTRFPGKFQELDTRNLADNIEHVSPIDKASLILYNRTLFCALGSRHWSSLRPGQANGTYRELFLTTLTRDLSDHFFSHFRSRLDLRDNLGPLGSALQSKDPLLCVAKQAGENLWLCVRAHPSLSRYRFALPSAASFEKVPLRA